MSRRAVILAGGKGTRLRPYTTVLPKPLMPIGDYPILEVIVRQLVASGFDHITLAVNHQAEIIKAYFQNGERWGVYIDYSLEESPLGTMAPLKLINNLPDNFLVMNGDVLTDLDFDRFYNCHIENKNTFTISSKSREHKIDYGVLEVNSNSKLTGFREKPNLNFEVSMGVYMISARAISHIPENCAFGFDDLMLKLIGIGEYVHVQSFDGYWLDIGRSDDYIKAIEEFDVMRSRFIRD